MLRMLSIREAQCLPPLLLGKPPFASGGHLLHCVGEESQAQASGDAQRGI